MTGSLAFDLICKNDPRFYLLDFNGAILGIGWDDNENGIFGVTRKLDGKRIDFGPYHHADNGIYAYDGLASIPDETADLWFAGWMGGYWRYYTQELDKDPIYSNVGAGSRIMQDGSWDTWRAGGGLSYTFTGEKGDFYPGPAVPEDFPEYFDQDGVKYHVTYFGGKLVDVAGLADGNTTPGNIVIPEKVEYGEYTFTPINVAESAFSGTAITGITLSKSVEEIRENAFANCTRLTKVEMPDLLRMKPNAFVGCRSLKSVAWPEAIVSVPEGTFKHSGLETFEFPATVTAAEASAFQGSQLNAVTFTDALKSIGDNCFADARFSTITLPATLTKYGEGTFTGNPLNEVYHYNVSPFRIPASTFDAATYASATLYVPVGQIESFRSVSGWQSFTNIKDELDVTVNIGDVIKYQGISYKVIS